MATSLNEQDLILLNAYIDDELTAEERAVVQARLEQEPILRTELESLRVTAALLGMAERIPVPRNFTLDPAVYGRPQRRGLLGNLSMLVPLAAGAALAAALMCAGVIMLAGQGTLGYGVAQRAMPAAEAPAAEMLAPEAEETLPMEEPAAEEPAMEMPAPAEAAALAEEEAEEEPAAEEAYAEEVTATPMSTQEPADAAAAVEQPEAEAPPAEEEAVGGERVPSATSPALDEGGVGGGPSGGGAAPTPTPMMAQPTPTEVPFIPGIPEEPAVAGHADRAANGDTAPELAIQATAAAGPSEKGPPPSTAIAWVLIGVGALGLFAVIAAGIIVRSRRHA